MRLLGLFIVVFAGVAASRALGFNDVTMLIGVIVGSGSYIIISEDSK